MRGIGQSVRRLGPSTWTIMSFVGTTTGMKDREEKDTSQWLRKKDYITSKYNCYQTNILQESITIIK